MEKLIILSIINAIMITFLYKIIKKNISNKSLITENDFQKYNNKKLLIIFILSILGTYGCLYVYENKLLDNILSNEIEIKSGEPGF
jgi:predicted RNase H-related nuclease YkuK (DUF458 family)